MRIHVAAALHESDSRVQPRSMGGGAPSARGYALLMALIALAVASLALGVAVQGGQIRSQREREAQLLYVGHQYRLAIEDYYARIAPAGVAEYPKRLEDLVEDPRFPAVTRHLRKLYPDPMTGQNDWVLEKAGDRVVGVHSRSTAKPLRKAHFPQGYEGFAKANDYSEWTFKATVPNPAAAPPANGANGAATGNATGTGSGTPSTINPGNRQTPAAPVTTPPAPNPPAAVTVDAGASGD